MFHAIWYYLFCDTPTPLSLSFMQDHEVAEKMP